MMINRAFMKYYWRKAWWVFLVMINVISYLSLPINESASNQLRLSRLLSSGLMGEDWLVQGISHYELVPMVVILSLLTVVLFLDDRHMESGDLMYSLPIARQSLFFTKWSVGIIGISITYLFLLARFRQLYIHFGHLTSIPFGVVIQFVVAIMLTSLLLYTILLLVQTLIGRALVAGAIGCLLILGFGIATTLFTNLIWYNTGLPYDHPFIAWLMRVKHVRLEDLFMPDLVFSETSRLAYGYQHWGAKVMVLVIGIGLAYWLGHLAYTKGRAERRGELFIFPSLRPIFLWVTALGIGLSVAYWLSSPGLGHNVLRLDLLFLVGTTWSYILLSKALRAVGHA